MSTAEPEVVSQRENDVRANSGAEGAVGPHAAATFSSRGFTSLLLTIAFGVLGFSGVMMYLMPRGRLANWSDWQMLGLTKAEWGSLHVNISILFVVVALLHLVLNWSIFWSYLRQRAGRALPMRKELFAAVVVSSVFVAGPILDYPPFRSIMVLNYQIKDYWERTGASTGGEQVTDVRSDETAGAGAAEVSAGPEAGRGGPTGEVHEGSGPRGDGYGQGRGMGWGRRMGGGFGLGPGRGAGAGGRGPAIEQESQNPDDAATDGG